MSILILLIYLWLGAKAITFIRTKVFHVNYIYIGSISNFIFNKVFWPLLLGWVAIPAWLVLSLIGFGKK